MKVGYVYDPVYLKHDTGDHVENVSRLEAITSCLKKTGLDQQLTLVNSRPASIDEIALIHNRDYIFRINDTAKKGGGWLDPDTVISPGSYEAAIHAAGGAIKAVESVLNKELDNVFALVRPPGHHATPRRAMGFCLFNNIAIAARYTVKQCQLERVAIIDFDVHHGNGTQEAFYDDPQVLYISTHESPFYPGTGGRKEIGIGSAEGTTINIPLPSGCGDHEYLQAFHQVITPAVKRFMPELIFVSAGYDLHWADRLALMQVSTTGFAGMVTIIKELANELCDGRLVLCLEGGYDLEALSFSVKATFDVLLGNEIEDSLGQPAQRYEASDINSLLNAVKLIHNLP